MGDVRLSARASGERNGEVVTRAILTFDVLEKKNQRTPMVENVLLITSTERDEVIPTFTVRPRFPSFIAE